MKIVVLAWGSLVWDPRKLKVGKTWHENGPCLPIEFARKSKDGRLTLVIYPQAKQVTTLWALSTCATVEEAMENLRKREKSALRGIGWWRADRDEQILEGTTDYRITIAAWGLEKKFDAVIWTDLSTNFEEEVKKPVTKDAVCEYIRTLAGEKKDAALAYIRKAPEQIETDFRPALMELTK